MDWNQIIAAVINSVLVLVIVQALKTYAIPWLKANAPWSIPFVAQGVAFLVTWCSNLLAELLGYPIDLSAIVAVFAGLLAVGEYNVLKKAGWLK